MRPAGNSFRVQQSEAVGFAHHAAVLRKNRSLRNEAVENAVRIGMFPNVPLELFHYIGNSSLAGAYTMALSDEANDRVEQVARNMTYMELSTHPGYMDAFVAACFLPHTDAARFASAE